MRFTIIFKDPRTTTRSNFSLVDRLLDSEQELHHRCEGRSFASQLFAPTFLVVTEGINTLEFIVVTIVTIHNKRKTNDDDNVEKSRMMCKHRQYIDQKLVKTIMTIHHICFDIKVN